MRAVGVLAALAVILGTVFAGCGVTTVAAGHAGVVSTFGEVNEAVLDAGITWLAPWRSIHELSLQTKEDKEAASVPTKEGASVQLEASLLYSLAKDRAAEVYRTVGKNYEEVLVQSQFRSALRGATTHYKAEDLYTANREKIEGEIFAAVKEALAKRGIVAEAVMLRGMELPKVVSSRIEAKLGAEQDNLRMTFVLQQAQKESERKVIEAKGIADAQAIIKKDLDHHYLVYLWIEALKECAQHKNATIYVPTGPDGMPMFKAAGPAKVTP
jgi:regulator of protease activity HflC (stomatin/prohibitin superfamily)